MSKTRISKEPIFCDCGAEYTEEAQDRGEHFAKTENGEIMCELCLEDVIEYEGDDDIQYFINWK